MLDAFAFQQLILLVRFLASKVKCVLSLVIGGDEVSAVVKRTLRNIGLCLLLVLVGCASPPPPTPVGALDAEFTAMKGVWFDIAHLSHDLQDDCRDTASLYRYDEEQPESMEFIFECRWPDELWYTTLGEITRHDDDSKLFAVEFSNGLIDRNVELHFWVLDVAEDYSWLVTGSPEQNWLWIMSRYQTLDDGILQGILSRLMESGLYTSTQLEDELLYTQHESLTAQ